MWPNSQGTADLVTFTQEILNGKLHFLCSVINYQLIRPMNYASLSNRNRSFRTISKTNLFKLSTSIAPEGKILTD